MKQLLGLLGVTLMLGGVGHSVGVAHLYITQGMPDVNRVLLDAWVAEAQIIGDGMYPDHRISRSCLPSGALAKAGRRPDAAIRWPRTRASGLGT